MKQNMKTGYGQKVPAGLHMELEMISEPKDSNEDADSSLIFQYLLFEGPGQQGIVLASHHHKEQRQVRSLAHAISIQVDACTHLVPEVPGVKRL